MKVQRYRKGFVGEYQQDQNFMDDLEQSLMTANHGYGLDALQQVFNQKKHIDQMIAKQRKLKLKAYTDYLLAKKRIAQIQQLEGKTSRQAAQLQAQITKLNDVLIMNKIHMRGQIFKYQNDTDDARRKRSLYKLRKGEEQKCSLQIINKKHDKLEKLRSSSLSNSIAMKEQAQMKRIQSIQENRRKAQSVRLDESRRKVALQRIQQYKLRRAHKNRIDKINTLQQTLHRKQLQLYSLGVKRQKNNTNTNNNNIKYINQSLMKNQKIQGFFPLSKTQ